MRKLFFLFLFLLFSQISFAEKINFLLPSASEGERLVSVPIEWNEKWFGENPSTVYNHNLARIACYFSDAAYSDISSDSGENVLFDAYKKIGVKESDIESHYDIDYSDALWGIDQCAFSVASKKITSSNGSQTLVFVVIRGTPLNASEWLSNLNINDSKKMEESVHKGFARAANIVHTAVISYMLRHQINPTDSFLFVTGHSRGAAVSNLLSAIILEDDFFKRENIYTYTFASPNVTTKDDVQSEKYGFIWNIVNAEDIVPTVPMNREKWKFKKFGHVLSFVNQTNTEKSLYRENFCRRISEIYEPISGREYKPFTTGPFVPIVTTRFVEKFSWDVEKYYSGFVNIHRRAARLMRKLFPEEADENDDEEPDESENGVGSWLVSWLNRRTGGLFDYTALAISDMHSNNVYLSYMLALSENEIFSDTGYSMVVLKGYEECGVFDSDGNMMARVLDGKIFYSDVNFPLILCPTVPRGVIVGYPANMDFKIVVTDEAILPTKTTVTVEFFDSAGVYKESKSKKIYLRRNLVLDGEIGEKVLENQEISLEKMPKKDGKILVKDARLRPQSRFNLIPELYLDTDLNLGFALHAGTPVVFGSVMSAKGFKDFKKSYELGLGIGNQQTLWSQVKYENEIFAKCLFYEKTDGNEGFAFVPNLRSSLSVRLVGRLRFFTAGSFDFQIAGLNENAFESEKRKVTIHTFRISDSVRAAPSIQFGFRF